MADLVGLNRKPPEKYTPQEIAAEVVADWLKSGRLNNHELERVITAALRFEREQCARIAESMLSSTVVADTIRNRTPGMEPTRPGAVILRG